MRVLIVSNHFPPAELAGGPARSLEAMVRATKTPEHVSVLTSAHDLGGVLMDVPTDTWVEHAGTSVRYVAQDSPIEIMRALAEIGRSSRPKYLYLNSFLNPLYSLIPLLLARIINPLRDAQILLAPRGELDPGALAIKPTRKRIYLWAGKWSGLFRNVIWHATSTSEKASILRMFPRAEVFINPNRTLLPSTALEPAPRDGPLKVAFLSRIAPIKGLDIVLRAVARVEQPVVLNIYGNEEDSGYSSRCRELAAHVPDHIDVHFHGAVRHHETRKAFSENDIFAFPTAGENFGHVIAEALSASCPVMVPDTTPWSPVARRMGTLVESREPDTWAKAFDELGAKTPLAMLDLRRQAGAAYERWWRETADAPNTLDDIMTLPTRRDAGQP